MAAAAAMPRIMTNKPAASAWARFSIYSPNEMIADRYRYYDTK
jgi:hypothetical protein